MSSGNQINAKVSIPEHYKDKKRKGPNRQLTLEIIKGWIKLQGFDEYTTNGLIELAEGYPTNALPNFRRNFNLMIARVRQKRREEQHEQDRNITKPEPERKENAEEENQPEV